MDALLMTDMEFVVASKTTMVSGIRKLIAIELYALQKMNFVFLAMHLKMALIGKS